MKKLIFKKIDDLTKIIDVDGAGRSVPENMNFVDESYLTKDTGFRYLGDEDTSKRHSLFIYKKDDGTQIKISAIDTKLQKWNGTDWEDLSSDSWTAGHEFGFIVYNNVLYGGNGEDDYFSYDGTTLTKYSSAPKGNAFEIFEDRIFVANVKDNKLSLYYSNVSDPTIFPSENVVKPLGVDDITSLYNYYGVLLIFKKESIWKLEFVWNQVASDFLPKLSKVSGSYGAYNKDSLAWVENDVWFFTGKDVRSISLIDNTTGKFGVNKANLSDKIKETLKSLNPEGAKVLYSDKRFYLAIDGIVFVNHLLHGLSWTKYSGRKKSDVASIALWDEDIMTTTAHEPYRTLKWTDDLDDEGEAIVSKVYFARIENELFNKHILYRYLDLKFLSLNTLIRVVLKSEKNDQVIKKIKDVYVGNLVENMENPLAETVVGQELVADSFGDNIETSPFIKKRISFLEKSQALIIGIEHSRLGETFTLAEIDLIAFDNTYRQLSPKRIISIK